MYIFIMMLSGSPDWALDGCLDLTLGTGHPEQDACCIAGHTHNKGTFETQTHPAACFWTMGRNQRIWWEQPQGREELHKVPLTASRAARGPTPLTASGNCDVPTAIIEPPPRMSPQS